jgi:hypothetical protein
MGLLAAAAVGRRELGRRSHFQDEVFGVALVDQGFGSSIIAHPD